MKPTLILIAVLAGTCAAETPLEMANRGANLYADGHYTEAESCYRQAIEQWPVDAQPSWGKAIVQGNLGSLLRTTGRYSEAKTALSEALGPLENGGELAVPYVAFVLDETAVLYHTQGDLTNAEAYALRARRVATGRETVTNQLVLASIYVAQKRFNEAVPLLQPIAASEDPRAAYTANLELASAALMQGHLAEGEADGRHALELAQHSLPANHPALAKALFTIAQACRQQHNYLDAEKNYRQAIDIWEAAFGPDNPDVAKGLLGLAALYHERQRDAGAESLSRRALGILEHWFGAAAPQVVAARAQLAGVLRGEGRVTEAAALVAAGK